MVLGCGGHCGVTNKQLHCYWMMWIVPRTPSNLVATQPKPFFKEDQEINQNPKTEWLDFVLEICLGKFTEDNPYINTLSLFHNHSLNWHIKKRVLKTLRDLGNAAILNSTICANSNYNIYLSHYRQFDQSHCETTKNQKTPIPQP